MPRLLVLLDRNGDEGIMEGKSWVRGRMECAFLRLRALPFGSRSPEIPGSDREFSGRAVTEPAR